MWIPGATLAKVIRIGLQAKKASCIVMPQTSWVLELFYQLSLTLSKISILFLYIRVFKFQWASRATWSMLAVVVIYNIVSNSQFCLSPIMACLEGFKS